jgi:hypothetical protein
MVSRGKVRALGVWLAALALVLFGVVSVSAASSCSVTVSPRSGTAGTVFTFHGEGFKPTGLTLHKDNAEAGDHSLSESKDPWTVTVRSRPGDEGDWSAEFVSAECSDVARFKITLPNTDVAGSGTKESRGTMPLGLAALVLVSGAGSGLILGRRLRASSADNAAL